MHLTNWEHYLDDKLTAFPNVGQAIRNKTPFVLTKPTIDDLFEDTNVRMYNLQVDDPTALTDPSVTSQHILYYCTYYSVSLTCTVHCTIDIDTWYVLYMFPVS